MDSSDEEFYCNSSTDDVAGDTYFPISPVALQNVTLTEAPSMPMTMRAFNEKSIVHMFLTKQIPEKLQDDLHQIEDDLLAHVAGSVSKTMSSYQFNELKGVQAMLDKWIAVQPSYGKQSTVLMSELESLEFEDTIPVYVREQNCTMMISKLADEKFRIQTFRPSLPSETIMSSVGSLEMDFPETLEIIENTSLLTSKIFSTHLYEMALESFQLSMKSIEKGGSTLTETRDVPQPFLVTDWAVGVLVPRKDAQAISVTKKIRDQVTMTNLNSRTLTPFRRSGMWMSIKVVLQLKLLEIFKDEETAKLVYKIVMLRVLVDACKEYRRMNQKFDLDIASQMLAKIGRRVVKLEKLQCGDVINEMKNEVEPLRSIALQYTLDIMTKLRETVENLWNGEEDGELCEVRPIVSSQEDFPNYLVHTNGSLNEMVKRARQLIESQNGSSEMDIEAIKRKVKCSIDQKVRYDTMQQIMSGSERSRYNNENDNIWLYDTESYIKEMDETCATSEQIFNLANAYLQKAWNNYTDNPVGFSQMVLVSLKLVYILDKIAIAKHPLLKEYRPNINTQTFDCLLLPHRRDVELLNELVEYFDCREAKGTKPILERVVSTNTLSVRYAMENANMTALKNRIERDIEEAKQRKFAEADRAREECRDLVRRMAALGGSCSCKYEWRERSYWSRYLQEYRTESYKVKIYSCDYCPLKSQLDWKRKSVNLYEIPLPPQDYLANAVVFELLIPNEISHLRQFLAIFKYELLGTKVFDEGENTATKHWLDYGPINAYTSHRKNMISVVSTTMPSSSTYHSNSNPDLLWSSNQSFIVNNGMNCHFYFTQNRTPVKNFKEHCTFQIKLAANSEAYLSLQKYLASTNHFQNNVIANQSECHADLSANEYVTYGSLRGGHRIQLRNLYMGLTSRSLTLEKEPVLALILQTIWQVGPRDENGNREVYSDFQLTEFAMEFLEMLEKIVKSNEANYSIPLVLLTAIVITGRIMEVNEACHDKCFELFKEWRQLSCTWCDKIENEFRESDASSRAKNKVGMQKILHEIKLCSMMTYNVFSQEEMSNVMKDPEDMAHYLHTISSKHLLNKESNPNFSGLMRILKSIEGNIAVVLRLETKFPPQNIINRSGLSRFIKAKFPPASQYPQYELTNLGNIVTVQYSNDHYITIDMLSGELLINGYPETELSSQISGNIEFKRFFQKYLNFRVQRQSDSVLGTVDPIHGKHYEFITKNSGTGQSLLYRMMQNSGRSTYGSTDLDIVEIHKDQPRLVLIPHETFRRFISDQFIDNYTHWLDPIKERVYFRRIAANDGDYDLPHEYELMNISVNDENNGWIFRDDVSQEYFMSINSIGFSLVTESLSRLELRKYINVTMDKGMEHVYAHLPRHNLRFSLQANGLLESLEYPGFQVCTNQHCGTFVGLRHGLLLINGSKRNIIIPHGKLKVLGKSNAHHACEIELESISQPSFYIYELDEVLKRIVAKKRVSAWLYLAALHAITSSSQPDPFTGKTGTEMAVGILQSALVWSCSPYDKESLEILKFIKGISPSRNYYGHKMNYSRNKKVRETIETIEWPFGIPPMAAFDGYVFLVDKLVRDSVRLKTLHPIKFECKELYTTLEEEASSEKLLLRAYLRNLDKYNEEIRLDEDMISKLSSTYETSSPTQLALRQETNECVLSSMLAVSYNRHLCDKSVSQALSKAMLRKNSLVTFLFTSEELVPAKNSVDLSLSNLLSLEFRPFWLTYYSLATSDKIGHHEFTLLMSALAYRGVSLEQINILHCIRTLKDNEKQQFPQIPALPRIDNPTRINYVEAEVAKILKNQAEIFSRSYAEFDDFNDYKVAKSAYDSQIDTDCQRIAQKWKSDFWPCSSISSNQVSVLKEAKIKDTALSYVNNLVSSWFNAREMKIFMDEVQEKLNDSVDMISCGDFIQESPSSNEESESESISVEAKYYDVDDPENDFYTDKMLGIADSDEDSDQQDQDHSLPLTYTVITPQSASAVQPIRIEDLVDDNEPNDLESEAEQIFEKGKFQAIENHDWSESKSACLTKIIQIQDTFEATILNNIHHKILNKAGLIPRLVPLSLLRILKGSSENVLEKYVGALGVLWTHLKRLNRILHFELHGLQADLERETQNSGHNNWRPKDFPDWLLLELELDIMIRDVQVDVARRMMKMLNDTNGVMQLNMGEGKTSVIVPMLTASLAGNDSLCRVTVLSSIFKMNWGILKFTIGGLLNRRLYSFPCRRDMKIDLNCINDIQEVYCECLNMKGVVLTLPEYRLSFRLLAYDKILKNDTAVGMKLLQTEDWLRWYARDILDESDELLSVKYQLVYTIGSQVPVDGGNVRWGMCQEVLSMIQDIAPELLESNNDSKIEYNKERKKEHPHEFVTVRLLAAKESNFIKQFENRVAEKYLADLELTETDKTLITQFLYNKELSMEVHAQVIATLGKDPALLNRVLILAGYIHRGVLSLALSKRWRVEFGVDPKGARKMAVPFRAKDVAAERTEFGHPDLAIILTHLSYYYSGLTDTELEEVFKILAGKLGPDAIYSEWIHEIPESQVQPSLTDYFSLNLKDVIQKSTLFDLIRKHKMVIDFWLSHRVFPRESKQFPGKLVMTAWELVYERQRLPVTGFSGTNDSIILLPLTINQHDLDSLKGTNDKMEEVLLGPENNGHRNLHMGATCDNILAQMKEDKLRILIDSGALMLELDNHQVAERWLEIDPQIQAVVYFNKDNELMVKSRNSGVGKKKERGRWRPASSRKIPDVPFELSPYQGKLGECGVFLDDQHTRGTDLKFPVGSKACVTIGSRMKREKLLQACMRMRKLGHGHSVAFYLSHEASIKVGSPLSTGSVLDWVKQNTKEFNDDGLLHWAISGKNYAQRLAAEDIFHYPSFKNPIKCGYEQAKARILADQCVDKEVHLLMDMYGLHSKWELLYELIAKWFDAAKKKLSVLNRSDPPDEVLSRFNKIGFEVIRRCLENVPGKLQLSSSTIMDEEQEKELELEKEAEVEEERQVERPRKCSAVTPYLHPNVKKMVEDGGVFTITDGVMRLSDIFKGTNFAGEVQADDWGVEVYATSDFISVIIQYAFTHTNNYLRPMEYFVSNKSPDGIVQILFLSPYEVNLLLPQFRNNETSCPLHMFTTRRFEKQDMLINLPRLQLPPPVPIPEGKFRVLKSGSREMAAILLASGSLYFNNNLEQRSFALFLSLVPKPWTPPLRILFQRGLITQSGFLLPEFRRNMVPRGFQRDPTGLVRKILDCRHPVLSEVAHVVRLLDKKKYVELRQRGGDESHE